MKRAVIALAVLLLVSVIVNVVCVGKLSSQKKNEVTDLSGQQAKPSQPVPEAASKTRTLEDPRSTRHSDVQLSFLRRIASQEDAVKTVAAIDRFLEDRKERMKRTEEVRKQRREEMRNPERMAELRKLMEAEREKAAEQK